MSLKESHEFQEAIKKLNIIISRERDIFNANQENINVKKKAIDLVAEWLLEVFNQDLVQKEQLESGLENIFISQSDTQVSE